MPMVMMLLASTVPIVKEGMAEADARNNPRAKKEDFDQIHQGGFGVC